MQGRETYKHAVRNMVHVCEEVLARNGLSGADVDLLVPHQANMRIIEAVGSRLELTGDRVFTNVEKYGNTSSASIPLALSEARAQGPHPPRQPRSYDGFWRRPYLGRRIVTLLRQCACGIAPQHSAMYTEFQSGQAVSRAAPLQN